MGVVAERDRRVVHRSHHVPGERQDGVLAGRLGGEVGVEGVGLGTAHRLHGHQVGPRTRPASWDGAAVEKDHQPVRRGVLEYAEISADRILLVRVEEVDLDPRHAPVGELRHLAPSDVGLVHPVPGALPDRVVRAPRVVPEQDADTTGPGILHETAHLRLGVTVPVGVDQRVLPTHPLGQLQVEVETGEVLGAVMVRPPTPGDPPGADPANVVETSRCGEVVDQVRFGDFAGRLPNDDHPPRHQPGEPMRRLHGADPFALGGQRRRHPVRVVRRFRSEPAPDITGIEVRFCDQQPLFSSVEQRREAPTGRGRSCADGDPIRKEILIRRGELPGCLAWLHPCLPPPCQGERRHFTGDRYGPRRHLGKSIAEGDAVVVRPDNDIEQTAHLRLELEDPLDTVLPPNSLLAMGKLVGTVDGRRIGYSDQPHPGFEGRICPRHAQPGRGDQFGSLMDDPVAGRSIQQQ